MKVIRPIHQQDHNNDMQFKDQLHRALNGNLDAQNFDVSGQLRVYPNNAAARIAGLQPGQFYRSGGDPDRVCVVH